MSPRDEILSYLGNEGWALLPQTPSRYRLALYRWDGHTRIEVQVTFDDVGRVYAWSEWRNVRVGPVDQERGRRDRLISRLAAGR